MTVLSPPRNPLVQDALDLARAWCAGHVINGDHALHHAVEVTLIVGRYVPDAPAKVFAAVLLHDAPEFAPAGVDLDAVLFHRFGASTARIVRALAREQAALEQNPPPVPDVGDPLTLYASAADKIVSLGSVLSRADSAADVAEYWRQRAPFLALLPYFRAFHRAAAARLPGGMADALAQAIVDAEAMATAVK